MSALTAVTAANAVLYLAAAILHSGVMGAAGATTLGFQPSPAATVAEGLIGVVLTVAAVMLFRSPSARRLAWGAYLFSLAGRCSVCRSSLPRGSVARTSGSTS